MSYRYMVNKLSGEVFMLNAAWMAESPDKWEEVADAKGTPLNTRQEEPEQEPVAKKTRAKKAEPTVEEVIAEADALLSRDASVGL